VAKRWFTVEKANRALPLVSRILEDLLSVYAHYRRVRSKSAQEPRKGTDDGVSLGTMEDRIRGLIEELERVGCQLKDLQKGLIDFRARDGESEICLCWQKGEPEVAWWHSADTGFAGRRPVTELPDSLRFDPR